MVKFILGNQYLNTVSSRTGNVATRAKFSVCSQSDLKQTLKIFPTTIEPY
jgi:hypothetical protein